MRLKDILFATSLLIANSAVAEHVDTLARIIVTGTRSATDARHLANTISVVDSSTLTQDHRAHLLPTVMEHVPNMLVTARGMMGYGVSTGGTGSMVLRGVSSSTGGMMVLIDGNPQYNGIFGHAMADAYLTQMAERVEVLRGPASALYGSNAMGGVLNIITRRMPADGVRTHVNVGAGSWGTVEAEADNEIRKGRFASNIAAQYGRTDNHRADMGFQQYGGLVKMSYELHPHWQLQGLLQLTHFNASHPGAINKPKLDNDQWITRGNASITLNNKYKHTSGAISVYNNFGRHKIDDGYNPGETPLTDLFRSRDALTGISVHQLLQLAASTQLTAGIDYQHIYGHAWYTDRLSGETVTTTQRQKQSTLSHEDEVAPYLSVRQHIGSHFTLDAALRYDHHSTAGGEWVPQGGVVYRPLADAQLRAMVSKGFRNPTVREMYLYGTANSESLRAERAVNYELSWQQQLAKHNLTYGITLFYLDGSNAIQVIGGKNVNSGNFRNCGIEADLTWHITPQWSLTTNHSYLHMQTPLASAPTYKGYLSATYTHHKWQAHMGLQQIGGMFVANGDWDNKETFTLLNASVSHHILPCLTLWVKGENLLAQRYELVAGYPMPRATFMGGCNLSF